MTRATYNQEVSQANSKKGARLSQEENEILHLKQLLVTLKQQHEKNLQDLQEQLRIEAAQKQQITCELQKQHEEELQALRQQQITLRDLFKKSQEELKSLRSIVAQGPSESLTSQQRVDQLERMIPYLKERHEEANLEVEHLREELERAQRTIKQLQAEIVDQQQTHKKEKQQLEQLLSQTPSAPVSDSLGYHLDLIKKTIAQEMQDNKFLENCYNELVHEKIVCEQQMQLLRQEVENQMHHLAEFKEHLQTLDSQKKLLESTLQQKEQAWQEQQTHILHLEEKIKFLNLEKEEKIKIQEKYEQLKDEYRLLCSQLEEVIEARLYAEQHLAELLLMAKDQEQVFAEQHDYIQHLNQEKEGTYQELSRLKFLVGENEEQLKVAQQHLAKKVKESALIQEQMQELHMRIEDQEKQLETSQVQINHLQTNIDLYQQQEKNLQEQLNYALKSTESQVSKWEEKYFKMYDKWQEADNRLQDLKKIEEKHQQMQSLLANLGSFMGTSIAHLPLFQAAQEVVEKPQPKFVHADPGEHRPSMSHILKNESGVEEKYDLFGMRIPQDKLRSNSLS